jgi:hypothetical protein
MPETHPKRFRRRDILSSEHRSSFLLTLLLLIFAYIVEHYANLYELEYSIRPTSTYVGDILLDNLPVVHLNFVIIEGALLGLVLGGLFLLRRPRYILFTLKAFALLIASRAFFISLTHVGIYPGSIRPEVGIFDGIYSYLNLQTGFFFSGHTAVPFLMALIFWKERRARMVFLTISLVFAVAVLLAHVHYSIDVFAAPFMTYGVFVIAKNLFKKDFELILEKDRLETEPI